MPASVGNGPSEAELIFARANVALAKSQRLIESWRPTSMEGKIANGKTEEELDQEEAELFKPMPELLGLGAPTPQESSKDEYMKRSSDQKLRKQLLGKEMAKFVSKKPAPARGSSSVPGISAGDKARSSRMTQGGGGDSGDEDARSKLGKTKKPSAGEQHGGRVGGAFEDAETPEEKRIKIQKSSILGANPEGGTYLDEILAQKARKKKKRRKRQKHLVATAE